MSGDVPVEVLLPGMAQLYFDYENDGSPVLNSDSLIMIFELLDFVELFRASLVCKGWYNMAMCAIQKRPHLSIMPAFSFDRLHRYLTDANFISILKKTNLTSLDISNFPSSITDNIAKAIRDHCPGLTKFSASNTRLYGYPEPETTQSLFALMTDVTFMDLENTCLNGEGLKIILVNCKSLESLNISKNKDIILTGNCFKSCGLNLKSLNVSFCRFENIVKFIRSIKDFDLLELRCNNPLINNPLINGFQDRRGKRRRPDVYEADESFKHILGFKQLKTLELSTWPLNYLQVAQIVKNLPDSLTHLRIKDCPRVTLDLVLLLIDDKEEN